MKRKLTICLALLLVGSSAALADDVYQDQSARPRRAALSNSSFLGVDLSEVTVEAAGRLKLREERGALVTGVSTDTAASKAGLQKDDVIVKWNGEAIESARELGRLIRETPAGRTVKLGVVREGREMEITATLGNREEYRSRYRVNASQIRSQLREQIRDQVRQVKDSVVRISPRSGYRMGLSLQSMSPQLAEYFGLKDRNGALVVFVHPDTGAAKAGIKAGDVILSVGGEKVESPARAWQIIRSKSEGPVEVKVMRDKQERAFTIQLEKNDASVIFATPDDLDDIVVEAPLVVIEPMRIEALPRITLPSFRIAIPAARIAPVKIAPIHIAPISPAIAPLHIAPMHIAPIHIAPVAMPEIRIAPISPPKISIPPLKLIMPRLVFTNPV
jgi:serine protease Do